MNCKEAKKLLALAAGGDLEAREQEALDEHVACCESCCVLLESYRTDRELIGSLRRAGPEPPEFEQFWAGLKEKLNPELRKRRLHVVVHRVIRAVTVAAVLLIVLTFIWHLDTGGPTKVPKPPDPKKKVSGPFHEQVEPPGDGQELELEECELCVDSSRMFDF